MTDTFSIQGLEGVVRKLRELGPKVQKRILVTAMRKGAAIVRKDAVARARIFDRSATPNKVYKQIVTRVNNRVGKRIGGVALQVGVKGGAKAYVDNRANRRAGRVGQGYEGPGAVFYWRFLEFGTSRMPAQPFMRPALANNVDRVTAAVVADLNVGISKIVGEA